MIFMGNFPLMQFSESRAPGYNVKATYFSNCGILSSFLHLLDNAKNTDH